MTVYRFAKLTILALFVQLTGMNSNAAIPAANMVGAYGDYHSGTHMAGANLGYHPMNWVRLHAGYLFPIGTESRFKEQARAGLKLFLPYSEVSPFLGVSSGFKKETMSIEAGVDYISRQGLNIGAGISRMNTFGANGAFIHVGQYF